MQLDLNDPAAFTLAHLIHDIAVGLPHFGYCLRSRQAVAGVAMMRTKADRRVRSRGVPASQLLMRPRFMAAAVSTCCRWVLASPM